MSLKKIWNEIVRFNNEYFPGWKYRKGPLFFSVALSGETGELCNLMKKLYGGGTNIVPVAGEDIVEECVDILVYIVLLLESMGFSYRDYEDMIYRKLAKLYERMDMNRKALGTTF